MFWSCSEAKSFSLPIPTSFFWSPVVSDVWVFEAEEYLGRSRSRKPQGPYHPTDLTQEFYWGGVSKRPPLSGDKRDGERERPRKRQRNEEIQRQTEGCGKSGWRLVMTWLLVLSPWGWAGGGGAQTWFLTTNTSDDFCVTWPHAPSMPLSTSLPGVLAFWGPFFPYCFLNGGKLNEERWCRV